MTNPLTLPPTLDAAMRYHGPCGLCGHPDARHRVIDAIASRVRAGDGPEETGEDYGISVELVELIADGWSSKRQAWKRGKS